MQCIRVENNFGMVHTTEGMISPKEFRQRRQLVCVRLIIRLFINEANKRVIRQRRTMGINRGWSGPYGDCRENSFELVESSSVNKASLRVVFV